MLYWSIGSVAARLSNYLAWIPMCVFSQRSASMLPNYTPDKTRPIMMLVQLLVCVCVVAFGGVLAYLESVVCGWTAQSVCQWFVIQFFHEDQPPRFHTALVLFIHSHTQSAVISILKLFLAYSWRCLYLEIWFVHPKVQVWPILLWHFHLYKMCI